MTEKTREYREQQAHKLVEALERKNYNAYYADDKDEARKIALSLIPDGASVGVGGSVTLGEIGLIDAIRSGGYNFIDRFNPPEGISISDLFRQSMTADVYFSSSNAVTENGELVNTDGTGNRVSAIAYGPEKVVIVVGVNKITENVEAGEERIKTIAAPKNAIRLGINTPCSKTGRCMNCSGASKICNMTMVTTDCKPKGRISVIVVPEDLGY